MSAAAKLTHMGACHEAVEWVGNRTIQQAWRACKRSDWMLWLLKQIARDDPRHRLAAADFAKRVWHLIPDEPTKLAAAWAIGAARRGDLDECAAAADAAAERAAQSDILRRYFKPQEIADLFDKVKA